MTSRFHIYQVDMPDDMVQTVFNITHKFLINNTVQKDIARHIKIEIDKLYEPIWHCVVGKNYGSYITHEPQRFIYFKADNNDITLFKAG